MLNRDRVRYLRAQLTFVCEYSPEDDRRAKMDDEYHADAVIEYCAIDGWRLCADCASRARFQKLKKGYWRALVVEGEAAA